MSSQPSTFPGFVSIASLPRSIARDGGKARDHAPQHLISKFPNRSLSTVFSLLAAGEATMASIAQGGGGDVGVNLEDLSINEIFRFWRERLHSARQTTRSPAPSLTSATSITSIASTVGDFPRWNRSGGLKSSRTST
ncbi:hypothetical protein CPLU01_15033, partial [Colletotrichum plurivorum]